MGPIQHETRIQATLTAYDNDGTMKMLLDILTVLVTQILAWIDDPHREQVHLMVDYIITLMPLVIELVRQTLVLVLLLIEILSMILCVMTSVGIIINACLDWCERRLEDTHFLVTGQIGVYA